MSIVLEQLSTGAARRGTKSAGVSITRCGNRLDIAGEIDLVTMPAIVAAVRACRDDCDLTLGLSQVVFVDAFGLGRMVELQQASRALGRRLRIVGASPRITRIFVLAGVSGLLEQDCGPLDPDGAEAL